MAIEQFIGLPGAGKSRGLMEQLKRDLLLVWSLIRGGLRDEARIPWFWLSIDMTEQNKDNFVRYFHYRGCLIYDRVLWRGMDDPARATFWRHRGPEEPNPFVQQAGVAGTEGVAGKFVFIKGIIRPVWYYLDDLARDFRAEDCRDRSRELRDYLSVHEHVGDKIYGTAQHPEQLDIGWRRLTEHYHLFGNASRRKFWGFSGLRLFAHYVYGHFPIKERDAAESWSWQTLDRELCECYKTAINPRAEGFGGRSIRWIFLALGLFVFGAFYTAWHWGRWKDAFLNRHFKTAAVGVVGGVRQGVSEIRKAAVLGGDSSSAVSNVLDTASLRSRMLGRPVVREIVVTNRVESSVSGPLLLGWGVVGDEVRCRTTWGTRRFKTNETVIVDEELRFPFGKWRLYAPPTGFSIDR